jgi:hypothetical protein
MNISLRRVFIGGLQLLERGDYWRGELIRVGHLLKMGAYWRGGVIGER